MFFRWSKNGRYYLHYSKLHNTIMARSKILLLEYEIWAYVTIIKILLLNVCSICRDRSCSHWLWNLITWYIEACRSCLHANTLIRFSNLETKSCRHYYLDHALQHCAISKHCLNYNTDIAHQKYLWSLFCIIPCCVLKALCSVKILKKLESVVWQLFYDEKVWKKVVYHFRLFLLVLMKQNCFFLYKTTQQHKGLWDETDTL